jgi:hypothetical protein
VQYTVRRRDWNMSSEVWERGLEHGCIREGPEYEYSEV